MRILSAFGRTLYWTRTPKTRYSKSELLNITLTKKSFRNKVRGAVKDYFNHHLAIPGLKIEDLTNRIVAQTTSGGGVPGFMVEDRE